MSVEETAQEAIVEAVEQIETVASDDTITPEAAAATLSKLLGSEVKPEDLEQFKNLGKWEAKLRKKSMEVAEQVKSPEPSEESSDVADFDDATRKALDAYIAQKVGPVLSAYQVQFNETAGDTFEDFLASHPDIKEDAPEFIARAKQLWTEPSIKNLKKALNAAYIEVSDTPEKREAAIKAEVERRLKEGVKEGEEIVEVKPKRGGVTQHRSAQDILDDPNLGWREKALLLEG